jgi:hypothetical protein
MPKSPSNGGVKRSAKFDILFVGEAACPGCSASCRLRLGALLIRVQMLCGLCWVPALRSGVKNAAPRPGHEVA